jgi:hypothetical protein
MTAVLSVLALALVVFSPEIARMVVRVRRAAARRLPGVGHAETAPLEKVYFGRHEAVLPRRHAGNAHWPFTRAFPVQLARANRSASRPPSRPPGDPDRTGRRRAGDRGMAIPNR